MNKRQAKKAWKRGIADSYPRWFGVPMPRRLTLSLRLEIQRRIEMDRYQILVDNIYHPSPLFRLLSEG